MPSSRRAVPGRSRSRSRASARTGGAAPPASDARLDALVAAGIRVFLSTSYRRAQMADVARELGSSPGNLYNYVESKEALFHLVLERGFGAGPGPGAPELPVPTPAPGATLALLRGRLAREFVTPALDAALARRRVTDPRAEIEAVARELYRLVAARREGIVLIERSARDWPELAALFYLDFRRGLLGRLERWIEARARSGAFRSVPSAAVAARFVNESVAWFAMHRIGDADSRDLDAAACEETVVLLLVNALAQE